MSVDRFCELCVSSIFMKLALYYASKSFELSSGMIREWWKNLVEYPQGYKKREMRMVLATLGSVRFPATSIGFVDINFKLRAWTMIIEPDIMIYVGCHIVSDGS